MPGPNPYNSRNYRGRAAPPTATIISPHRRPLGIDPKPRVELEALSQQSVPPPSASPDNDPRWEAFEAVIPTFNPADGEVKCWEMILHYLILNELGNPFSCREKQGMTLVHQGHIPDLFWKWSHWRTPQVDLVVVGGVSNYNPILEKNYERMPNFPPVDSCWKYVNASNLMRANNDYGMMRYIPFYGDWCYGSMLNRTGGPVLGEGNRTVHFAGWNLGANVLPWAVRRLGYGNNTIWQVGAHRGWSPLKSRLSDFTRSTGFIQTARNLVLWGDDATKIPFRDSEVLESGGRYFDVSQSPIIGDNPLRRRVATNKLRSSGIDAYFGATKQFWSPDFNNYPRDVTSGNFPANQLTEDVRPWTTFLNQFRDNTYDNLFYETSLGSYLKGFHEVYLADQSTRQNEKERDFHNEVLTELGNQMFYCTMSNKDMV